MSPNIWEIDGNHFASRWLYTELDAVTDGDPSPLPGSGSLRDQVRTIVGDIRDYEGTEFASLGYLNYSVFISGLDFTAVSDDELGDLFFAAAYAAERESNPEYLRHLEATLELRGRKYDRRAVYSKAMHLLDYKKRYDLALAVSPLVGYRALRNRVFSSGVDGIIRLDALETDPTILEGIMSRNDARSTITLISLILAGAGRLSDATQRKITLRLLDIDDTRLDMALIHLTDMYTHGRIISRIESHEKAQWDAHELHYGARLARRLTERLEYIDALRGDRGDSFSKPLIEISSPKAYTHLRAMVPTEWISDEIVTLYPNTAIARMRAKRKNAMSGVELPPTVWVFRVLASLEDRSHIQELTIIAHETITTNLEHLASDIETAIQKESTRVTLSAEILSIMVDTIASLYAYHHYTRDVSVFPLLSRLRGLEARLEWTIRAYEASIKPLDLAITDEKSTRAIVGAPPDTSHDTALLEAKKSLLETDITQMSSSDLEGLRSSWDTLLERTSGAVEGMSEARIEAILTSIEQRYKKSLAVDLWAKGKWAGIEARIPFTSKEAVIRAVGSIGFNEGPTGKGARAKAYETLAIEGERGVLLELLRIMNVLEIRAIYSKLRA